MKCGDIYLVRFPFTDGSSAKVRPVLVVSSDPFNRQQDVVVLPISSRPSKNDPLAYHLDPSWSGFSQTGLNRASSVRWTKPLTLSMKVFMRRLGSLPESTLAQVREKLKSVFS